MFSKLDYRQWCLDNKIHELFGIDIDSYGSIDRKIARGPHAPVEKNGTVPLAPELDDLVRLHFLARTRKVTTVLEFGSGKSTVVFADALAKNKAESEAFVREHLRKASPFEIHTVETDEAWVKTCKQNFPADLLKLAHFHTAEAEMTTFNGRICTLYKTLPNVCPDLIYLDGPDQYTVKNDIRGISTAIPERVPMAADILTFEPFLLPGTLIVTDGRTANARFLLNNLQRHWEHDHFVDEDVHTFELIESPLGRLNEAQLRFAFGENIARFK